MRRTLQVVGQPPRSSELLESACTPALPPVPAGFDFPRLVDARGRAYTYLRLSITDRCDFACVYCMPPSGEDHHAVRSELLTFEEVARLARVLAASGIDRIRFTGGEPLVRRDVVRMVELVRRSSGVSQLVMTTNGSRLSELAAPLAAAGLTGVNVSIDTLDAARFAEITRGGELARVLAGVHAALNAGLEVKVNAVVLAGVNDRDAGRLVDWAWQLGITPRFIELMPLGEAARLPSHRFISQAQLIALLGARVDAGEQGAGRSVAGKGPARYLEAADGSGQRVGFITAVSNEFCDSCNRLRIDARGALHGCLASRAGSSLRDIMRTGGSDEQIAWAVHVALGTKLAGHRFHDVNELEHTRVGMSLIGG